MMFYMLHGHLCDAKDGFKDVNNKVRKMVESDVEHGDLEIRNGELMEDVLALHNNTKKYNLASRIDEDSDGWRDTPEDGEMDPDCALWKHETVKGLARQLQIDHCNGLLQAVNFGPQEGTSTSGALTPLEVTSTSGALTPLEVTSTFGADAFEVQRYRLRHVVNDGVAALGATTVPDIVEEEHSI